MKAEHQVPNQITVIQGKPVQEALRRAVRRALIEHKNAGNSIAAWKDGRVVLIPAEEIQVDGETEIEVGESST